MSSLVLVGDWDSVRFPSPSVRPWNKTVYILSLASLAWKSAQIACHGWICTVSLCPIHAGAFVVELRRLNDPSREKTKLMATVEKRNCKEIILPCCLEQSRLSS